MTLGQWEDKDWLEVIIKGYHKDKQLKRILSVKCSTATKAGDNYMSIMLRANILGLLGSGTSVSTNLIVKKMISDVSQETLNILNKAFTRENTIYKKVLNKYGEMMRGTPLAEQNMWATCYYGSSNSIVMEDLKVSGFKLADRKTGLDLPHTHLMMVSLGRLHGLSVVAIERGIVSTNTFGTFGYLEESASTFYNINLTAFSNAIKNSWGPEWSDAAEKVKRFGQEVRERLIKKGQGETPLKVICHGDCWVNNLMYQYDHHGNPVHIKFVDFQVSHYGSFGWDLNYFLHSSVRPNIRDPNYTTLLKTYRDSMEETFKILGFDGKVPTVEQMKDECNRLCEFKFITDGIITPIIIYDDDDVVELDDLFNNSDKAEKVFATSKYQDYMKPALKMYIEEGTV